MKFDVDIDLLENQIKQAVLEQFDILPTSTISGRIGFSNQKRVPVFFNGFKFDFLVTEEYVASILAGLVWKDDVRVVFDSNIAVSSLVPGVEQDGVTLLEDDRVLLISETDMKLNGIWVVKATGSIRSSDMDTSSKFNSAVVPVSEGTIYAGSNWRCKTLNPTLGTTNIEFSNFNPVVPDATDQVSGKIRIATQAEVNVGESGVSAVTPITLKPLLDIIRFQLSTVVPPAPDGLEGITLSMSLYNALEAGTGDLHSCTSDSTPDGIVLGFYDGDKGTLTAWIDGVASGSKVLTSGSDIGTFTSLVITGDYDPIAVGSAGRGLYKVLDALVRSDLELSLGQHTYQLKHSLTGDSVLKTFYVDDPTTVVISGVTIDYPSTIIWISGVPSITNGENLILGFTVENAVKSHYNSTLLARVSSQQTQTVDITNLPEEVVPEVDGDLVYSDIEVLVNNLVYSENILLSIVGFNSKSVQGTVYDLESSCRVDKISSENVRKLAGTGDYPSTYGGEFDSSISLKDTYTNELQLLNGLFQWPVGNYTGNLPQNGPDYSSGMGTGWRSVLIDKNITLDYVSSLVITFTTQGTWTGVETAGIRIFIKVEGSTGWLSANTVFSLSGSPINDGDACMVYSDSTPIVKKISFGSTPRSGKLWILIRLPYGTDKKFSQNINVSNIN